jgi:hypothetical protein
MSDLTGWCVVCGAKAGEPCRVIGGGDGLEPGDVRPDPHFYRGSGTPEREGAAVVNEPSFYREPGESDEAWSARVAAWRERQ